MTGPASITLKNLKNRIGYILENAGCVENNSAVRIVSSSNDCIEKYEPGLIEKIDAWYCLGNAIYILFGVNISNRTSSAQLLGLFYRIIMDAYHYQFTISEINVYRAYIDDYKEIDSEKRHKYEDVFDMFHDYATKNLRTINYFREYEKLVYDFVNGIKPYLQLEKILPEYGKKMNDNRVLSAIDFIKNTGDYPGSKPKNAVKNGNKVLKKMRETVIDTENLLDASLFYCYCCKTVVNNAIPVKLRNVCSYTDVCEYMHNNKHIKPRNVVLKQYDNNSRMTCIINLGPCLLYDDEPPYWLMFIIAESVNVKNGIVDSERNWKRYLQTIFNITDEEFQELWTAKLKPEW